MQLEKAPVPTGPRCDVPLATPLVSPARGQYRYGFVLAVMINPPELPINDEARLIHILQA